MPADKRLWMTFPIDFWMHPKIRPLSDKAFRAFVEINGYSRLQDLDGRIPVAAADKQWGKRVMSELLANHTERPSLVIDGDSYVIWNYAQHQETRESIAKRKETNSANGVKGGRPPKNNPLGYARETQSVNGAKPNLNRAVNPDLTQPKAESESESESESDLTSDINSDLLSGHLLSAPAHNADEIEDLRLKALMRAELLGLQNLTDVRMWLEKACGFEMNLGNAVDLAAIITAKSKDPIASADKYVIGVCRKTPHRVLDYSADIDFEAAA